MTNQKNLETKGGKHLFLIMYCNFIKIEFFLETKDFTKTSDFSKSTDFSFYIYKMIKIPPNATSIEHDALLDCINLKEITIPPSVVTMEDRAFFVCSLVYEKIHAFVTSIGAKALGRCKLLEEVVFEEPSSSSNLNNYSKIGN